MNIQGVSDICALDNKKTDNFGTNSSYVECTYIAILKKSPLKAFLFFKNTFQGLSINFLKFTTL